DRLGRAVQLRDDVAAHGVGVPCPRDRRSQRRELADRRRSLLAIDVERGMGDLRRAFAPGLGIQGVEAVRYEGEAIPLAEEPDQAGGVTGELHDLEARNPVALADRSGD